MGNYTRGDYHRSVRPWTRNPTDLIGDYVGIELEVDLGPNRSYVDTLDALPDPTGKRKEMLRPATEADGSLSGVGGVEIVFPPIPADVLFGNKAYFHRAIRTMKEKMPDYNGHEQAGMHVNVNVTGWNTQVRNLTALAFHYLPKELIEAMGGRKLRGWCGQLEGLWVKYDNPYRDRPTVTRGTSRVILASHQGNHHSITNLVAKRLEFRYPASTLNLDQISRNVAFIYFVRDFMQHKLEAEQWHVKETLKETFGSPEYLQDSLVEFISTRRKSRKKELVMEVINASTNRSKATKPTVRRSANAAEAAWN